jgi:nitrous oxide reductase accessory protein NosL
MYSQSRRRLIATIIVITGVMAIFLYNALAADLCAVQHPIKLPDKSFSGRCNNCGMGRTMWARTWKTFENSKGAHEVCSFTCLAKFTVKNGENPATVKTALYQDPKTMVAAENAIFVVGSKAKGTMTKTSKLAFGSQKEAGEFVRTCGGKAMGFQQTFELAQKGQKK